MRPAIPRISRILSGKDIGRRSAPSKYPALRAVGRPALALGSKTSVVAGIGHREPLLLVPWPNPCPWDKLIAFG